MTDTDIAFALEAKSDQLNALDIVGADRVIRVREVRVQKGEQPVSVFFDGDHGRPWNPSKGMLRILAGAWGTDSKQWVGKHAQIYFEPTVMYAGKEVGGIRVRALSDIPAAGMQFALTINRSKREPYHVPLLKISTAEYPADKFAAALPAMVDAMATGKMTLQQVIAQCQKTGQLNAEQLAQLEAAAPVVIDDSNGDDAEQEVM